MPVPSASHYSFPDGIFLPIFSGEWLILTCISMMCVCVCTNTQKIQFPHSWLVMGMVHKSSSKTLSQSSSSFCHPDSCTLLNDFGGLLVVTWYFFIDFTCRHPFFARNSTTSHVLHVHPSPPIEEDKEKEKEKENRVYLVICPLFGRMSPGSRSLWTSKPDRLIPSFMCIYQKGTKSWRYVNGHWGVRHTTRARAAPMEPVETPSLESSVWLLPPHVHLKRWPCHAQSVWLIASCVFLLDLDLSGGWGVMVCEGGRKDVMDACQMQAPVWEMRRQGHMSRRHRRGGISRCIHLAWMALPWELGALLNFTEFEARSFGWLILVPM